MAGVELGARAGDGNADLVRARLSIFGIIACGADEQDLVVLSVGAPSAPRVRVGWRERTEAEPVRLEHSLPDAAALAAAEELLALDPRSPRTFSLDADPGATWQAVTEVAAVLGRRGEEPWLADVDAR